MLPGCLFLAAILTICLRRLGEMELLYSNAEDLVHSTCFQGDSIFSSNMIFRSFLHLSKQGLADIVKYDEYDVNQRPIDGDTFYWRYEYDSVKQRISVRSLLLKV